MLNAEHHTHTTAAHCCCNSYRNNNDSDDDDDEEVDEEAIQASVTRQGRTVQGKEGAPTRTRLQELGPRFTLKLRWLQEGTFDTEFGEYEWVHKRKEMDSSRRKFHL
jgi:rRNA maturation protein Rpf1